MRRPAPAHPAHPAGRAHGFTLVELMVALLLSLLIGVALLFLQRNLGAQRTRSSDVNLRDNEARAAIDIVTQDLSGAGFLFGGAPAGCQALLTWNATLGGGSFFTHHPVDAVPAANGSAMSFGSGLTLAYPPAGSTVPSEVLLITAAPDASGFNDSSNPVVAVAPNTAYSPMLTGLLPLVSQTGLTAQHSGLVMVNDKGQRACLRVPLSTVGSGAGSYLASSTGNLMPSGFYTSFVAPLQAAGFAGPLSQAQLFVGKVMDFGAAGSTGQTLTAYWIGWSNPVCAGSTNCQALPVLMRGTWSLADDSPIGTPQPVAAGVVSLQVRFGTDTGATGAVTAWQTSAAVTSAKAWNTVRSVRVALVTRSLYDEAGYVNPAASLSPGAEFSAVPIPAADTAKRFLVQTTEMAWRNPMWVR